jgi:hypothetical protein
MNRPIARRRRRSLKSKLLTLVGIVLALILVIDALTGVVRALHQLATAVGML